jgi:GTP-binding protein LepA
MSTKVNNLKDFLELTGLWEAFEAQVKVGNEDGYERRLYKFIDNLSLDNKTQKEVVDFFSFLLPENRLEGQAIMIKNPTDMPDPSNIISLLEPFVRIEVITPEIYTGKIIELISTCRGVCTEISSLSMQQIKIVGEVPLAEVIVDFYDNLKSLSRGYASMSYEDIGYRASNLVKIDILLNGKVIDPLSIIREKSQAEEAGRAICLKLKEEIPRQQIEIAIQAAIGARIIARETVKPYRKDVTAKLYGGDISRRMKLLDKQKEGKKKMKSFGNVEVPKEAFLNILKK